MGKQKAVGRFFLKVIILLADLMLSGRMFHSATEVVSNMRLPFLTVPCLYCTSVMVETDLNVLVG